MSFMNIRPNDRVYFTTPQGQQRSGKANALLLFAEHVVVNCGGPHGTPAVVNARNYVTHRPKRGRAKAGTAVLIFGS